VLRRRRDPALGGEALLEVKLGEDFLMSSRFTAGERALARLGLAPLDAGALDVVVGGLGLGYTAAEALAHPALGSLLVIEALAPVIDWHRRGLVPLGPRIVGDARCRIALGDFFARVSAALDPDAPARRFDAILLDIDHSPRHLLDARHAALYTADGLPSLLRHLQPGGMFALWSDELPDDDFLRVLGEAFAFAEAQVVRFANPYTGGEAANTIYLARAPA